MRMFLHGQKVGQHLRWMRFIGEAIPDRDTRITGQFFHIILSKAAILDAIIHASKDTGRIFNGFR